MNNLDNLHNTESYSGIIVGIDCRDEVTRETKSFLIEPSKYNISRIKMKYQNGEEGYELVNFDLPESYIGRTVQVNNSTWRNQNGIVVSRQEIVNRGGLELLSISVINSETNCERREK